MIQILNIIDGKGCFIKDRGIRFKRPSEILLCPSLKVRSLKSNNANLVGTQNATKW